MRKVVITGGCGFVGTRLADALLKSSAAEAGLCVVLFDVHHPPAVHMLPDGATVRIGDLRGHDDVDAAMAGASLVVHIASYGMTGYESMCTKMVREVNVLGTQNVIEACVRHGVGRLVYVSTFNAVFDGRTPIVGGDEATTTHVSSASCSDPYSLTKAQAEQMVLAADGRALQRPASCRLGPSAIQQRPQPCQQCAAPQPPQPAGHQPSQWAEQTGEQCRGGQPSSASSSDVKAAEELSARAPAATSRSSPSGLSLPGATSVLSGSTATPSSPSSSFSSSTAAAQLEQEPAELPVASAQELCEQDSGEVPQKLRTCALRIGGIWGPGEMRHVPRIVHAIRRGQLLCTFGDRRSLCDFVHVDNLVSALMLAAQALVGPTCQAGGKVYFVSDECPKNTCEFFRRIVHDGLGFPWPRLHVPYLVVYLLALLMEVVAHTLRWLTGRVVWVPLISRAEAATTAITHYAKCERARLDLGYEPQCRSVQDTVEWYLAHGYKAPETARKPLTVTRTWQSKAWVAAVLMIMIALAVRMVVEVEVAMPPGTAGRCAWSWLATGVVGGSPVAGGASPGTTS